MRLIRPSLALAVLIALAAAGVAVAVAAAAVITPTRVDGVHLGDTHSGLLARGKVGPIRAGCELGGPTTRSAKLKAPLRGSVNYTLHNPRRVDSITITGGAKARGVGIGATIAQIKAKFPHASVDHSTDQVFELALVRTPKRPHGRGRITFGVSTQTKRTTIIGVPFVAFCE